MIIWLPKYFDILQQHVEEQIMTSEGNMACNFINIKRSKHVSEIYGNGDSNLWQREGYSSDIKRDTTT